MEIKIILKIYVEVDQEKQQNKKNILYTAMVPQNVSKIS